MSSQEAAPLSSVDVVILAGGLGTRVRTELKNRPKVLAPVGGRPFLAVLLDWLAGQGAARVILCLGHGAEAVRDSLADVCPPGLDVVCSQEATPLGTGGALRLATPLTRSNPVMVMNGDTLTNADLNAFLEEHVDARAELSVYCLPVPSVDRFGSVVMGSDGTVSAFVEKGEGGSEPGLVSAGLYLLSRSMLGALPSRDAFSFERDFLEVLPPGGIRVCAGKGRFLDIGTPETLRVAAALPSDFQGGRFPLN